MRAAADARHDEHTEGSPGLSGLQIESPSSFRSIFPPGVPLSVFFASHRKPRGFRVCVHRVDFTGARRRPSGDSARIRIWSRFPPWVMRHDLNRLVAAVRAPSDRVDETRWHWRLVCDAAVIAPNGGRLGLDGDSSLPGCSYAKRCALHRNPAITASMNDRMVPAADGEQVGGVAWGAVLLERHAMMNRIGDQAARFALFLVLAQRMLEQLPASSERPSFGLVEPVEC
jgi:hypothetical protein